MYNWSNIWYSICFSPPGPDFLVQAMLFCRHTQFLLPLRGGRRQQETLAWVVFFSKYYIKCSIYKLEWRIDWLTDDWQLSWPKYSWVDFIIRNRRHDGPDSAGQDQFLYQSEVPTDKVNMSFLMNIPSTGTEEHESHNTMRSWGVSSSRTK